MSPGLKDLLGLDDAPVVERRRRSDGSEEVVFAGTDVPVESLIEWVRWEMDGWLEENMDVPEPQVQDVLTLMLCLLKADTHRESGGCLARRARG